LEKLTLSMVKKRYTYLLVFEEELWKQKESVKWKLQGDKTISYFHAIASGHKRKNLIKEIKDNDEIHTDQFAKGRTLHGHFCQLMGTQSQPMPNIHCEALYNSMDNLAVQTLDHPITIAEIENVITQLPNGKMAGPDGFISEIYKAFKTLLLLDFFGYIPSCNPQWHLTISTKHLVYCSNFKKRMSNFTW
jgi:hypothetical protein